jgi:hypothetical protein
MPEIVGQLHCPSLFWLDGHYSGGVTARGGLGAPVVRELVASFASKRRRILLFDDARLFDGGGL